MNIPLQDQQWDIVKQKKKKKKHQKKLSWGGDKSIYMTDSFNDELSGGSTIETLSTASSASSSSNSSTDCKADNMLREVMNGDHTTSTVRTKPPVYNGTRRSLDLGPQHKSQNRRSSEQIKHSNSQNDNGNISTFNEKLTRADSAQYKINGIENQSSKLRKSKSNGTITELTSTCADVSKTRGLKHWFPGIKNTVT